MSVRRTWRLRLIRRLSRTNRIIIAIAAGLVVLGAIVLAATLLVPRPAPLQLEGIVVSVQAKPPLAVASFQIRTTDGRVVSFQVGDLQYQAGSFNAAHLVIHEATAQPVIVTYHDEGDDHVATKLVDGPLPAGVTPAPGGAASSAPAALP